MTRSVIFISYNHKDEKGKEALLTHLGGLQRAGLIEAWSDDRIGAGADWEKVIDATMARAKVAILLITANFLNSEIIMEKEVPTLLARWKKEELTIIPVITKACAWENIGWLQKMNVRPKDGNPVWREGGRYADEELKRIALEVAQIVDEGKFDGDRPQAKPEGTRSRPTVIPPNKIRLTSEEKAVLQSMFSAFGKIVIKSEFGYGLSGSRVFQLRPFDVDGRHNLPVVAKIAPVGLIRQEWQAYEAWVKNKLPNIAGIESVSKIPPSGKAGLRYILAGGGTFEVQRLQDYYRQASTDDLRWVLQERLFKIMGQNWWGLNRPEVELDVQSEYDRLLPVNLLITITGPHGDAIHLEPDSLPPPEIDRGDRVHLQGFVVTEVKRKLQELTLNVPSNRKDLPVTSYRLRLKHVPDIECYRWGDEIDSIYGVVTETRHQLLIEHARQVLKGTIDLSEERLVLGNLHLRTPLLAYQDLLDNFRRVKISTVHGDFNLENILVDPKTRDVSLIDFAMTREGHVLHDLLRLETEIVTKLIPEVLAEAKLSAETICQFYQELDRATLQSDRGADSYLAHPYLAKPFAILTAIREEAQKYLRDLDDRTEYYQGLVLYLLGAMKFKNLDKMSVAPLPKQVAFWGAATVVGILKNGVIKPTSRITTSASYGVPGKSQDDAVISNRGGTISALRLASFKEALEQRSLVLFIGADLPREVTGLPSRADLARELAQRHGLDESLSLAEVAERVSRAGNRWEFTNFLLIELETIGRLLQPFHHRVVELVKMYQIETLLTTAYDNLLELAFQQAEVRLNLILGDSNVRLIRRERPSLIKLYGHVSDPKTLVVTGRDHRRLLDDPDKKALRDKVRIAFRENTVLFVGYNLADRDFLFLFDQIAESQFARTAYAVWPGLPAVDKQVWQDRGIVVLETAPFELL